MAFGERLLRRMQLAVFGEAFDGHHVGTIGLHSKQGAGFDRTTIDMHGAGAALAGVAADMGAGQIQRVAQEIGEQHAIFNFAAAGLAVYGHFDCCHCCPSLFMQAPQQRGSP